MFNHEWYLADHLSGFTVFKTKYIRYSIYSSFMVFIYFNVDFIN